MTKTKFALRLLLAGLCTLASATLAAQNTQQLVFTGLRSVASQGQFNAVQTDTSGNLYLLLDQKDGVRLLKTDPTATNILAQAQIGATGDIGLALALDPTGNLYVTGTTTSGSLATTSGVAFPARADTSTNSFIAKFDPSLNPLFVTYTGSGRTAVTSIAATADAVFITGSTFSTTLPVTPSGIIQSPASGSFQNGFVEKFNTTGTTLLYATYLSALNGDTAPSAIAADSSDNAYIAGYTTSTGYPTLNALVPEIIATPPSTTSGFLTKLTPAGDGIVFSTFIPGTGITSLTLDPAAQNLLLSGTIALGQFPIASVPMPLVNTTYQSVIRIPLDGTTVLASTVAAPGTQSTITPAPSGAAWIAGPLTTPLLPLQTLSHFGNAYALRVTAQGTVDQTLRFGGLPTSNPAYSSAPATLTSVAVDQTGQPIFAGSAAPTTSSSLLTTQTYDLPLYNSPTMALPSTLRNAVLAPGTCNGSACAGSAAFLSKLNPTTSAPSLALSTDASPNITLRNLGSATATDLQITTTEFTTSTTCSTTLPPASDCDIVLTGTGPGSITAQASNATTQTITVPAITATANPIVLTPKELDFGIQTSTSPATTRTITITNLGTQTKTFASNLQAIGTPPYTITQSASDCPLATSTTKSLDPGATCHITLSLTTSSVATNDGPIQANWTIGTGAVLLTAYSQAASLSASASEIDFGTQYTPASTPNLNLPRYLYLSNNSAASIPHTPVTLPASSPFTLTDSCPTQLDPHTICQIKLTYSSPQTSTDSTTLTLDQGITVLITGKTIPQPGATGSTTNPNLSVTPASLTFPNAVLVTSTSSAPQNVTIANTGTQPFTLSLTLTGDFTDTNNCPSILTAGTICTVSLTFTPSQPGTRQGLLTVSTGAGSTPAYVTLTGTATAILTANNGTVDFGSVIIGQPSVLWYKIAQPFNQFSATTSTPDFTAILVEDIGYGHGQPPTTAFSTTVTGTCTNCWLGLQFIPSSTSLETANLTLTSATGGSPYALNLTGTGLALTGLLLTPASNDFGPIPIGSTSAPALFTLTNATPSPITLNSTTATGDFALSTAASAGTPCTGTLAPNASCNIQIVFTSSITGTRTGNLTLNTSYGPVTSDLTGFGSPNTGLALNPTSLIFNNVPGPAATQQTITLANTGLYTLQIGTPTNTNTSFTPTSACTTLAAGATCSIAVTFTPASAFVNDTLSIPVTSAAPGNPVNTYTIPLNSTYTTQNTGLQITPSQTNYGPTPDSTLGLTRQFTINNLTAKSLTLALSLPRQFILAAPPCAALAPNASCDFSVTFLPLTNGDITGTLFAQATPTDSTPTLNGLAYVEGYGTGTGTLSITGSISPGNLVNFGQVTSGQSATQTLTLTNTSATPVTVRRISSGWPFLATSTCGLTLTQKQSCTVTLTYTPLNQQATGTPSAQRNNDAGALIVESDALSSPDVLDLTGEAAPLLVSSPTNTAPLISFAASQSSLTFAPTGVGNASAPQTLTLANTGTTTIHITALQSTPDFTVTSTCATLLPGASCPITASFTPQLPGTRIAALEITSDSTTPLEFISLLGNATPAIITFSPTSLDFGTVLVGTTSQLPIQITNNSTTPATFTSLTATGDYAVTGNCPTANNTLAPSTSCTAQVTFTPTNTGTRPGTLSLSNSLTTLPLTVQLTGIGAQSHLQIAPSTLTFASLAVGSSANLTLTLSNTGTATLTNIALSITGDYAVTTPCGLTKLAPGTSCAVTITFTPTTTGARTGTLTITSTDQSSPATIPLTGTGIANGTFTLTVNGAAASTATVKSGEPANYSLTLTPQNTFSGTVVLNCTPINPGQYATCSLLPSNITLDGAAQNAVATINTVTEVTTSANHPDHNPNTRTTAPLLCLLPAALLFFWRARHRPAKATRKTLLLTLLATALLSSGCGSGGSVNSNNTNPNLRYTPPGIYQYQVTATATTGIQITQTVILNLIVTAQ